MIVELEEIVAALPSHHCNEFFIAEIRHCDVVIQSDPVRERQVASSALILNRNTACPQGSVVLDFNDAAQDGGAAGVGVDAAQRERSCRVLGQRATRAGFGNHAAESASPDSQVAVGAAFRAQHDAVTTTAREAGNRNVVGGFIAVCHQVDGHVAGIGIGVEVDRSVCGAIAIEGQRAVKHLRHAGKGIVGGGVGIQAKEGLLSAGGFLVAVDAFRMKSAST